MNNICLTFGISGTFAIGSMFVSIWNKSRYRIVHHVKGYIAVPYIMHYIIYQMLKCLPFDWWSHRGSTAKFKNTRAQTSINLVPTSCLLYQTYFCSKCCGPNSAKRGKQQQHLQLPHSVCLVAEEWRIWWDHGRATERENKRSKINGKWWEVDIF